MAHYNDEISYATFLITIIFSEKNYHIYVADILWIKCVDAFEVLNSH